MIETVAPGAACVEMFSDVPESAMFPIEAATVARAVPQRRREFATVRYCAREALLQIGVAPVPILPDADRAPRWPLGVVGSLTHCAGYRGAAVARSSELASVGIDAEPHAALPGDVLDLVMRHDERARLRVLVDQRPELHWDRVAFCAKEAVYKAWFPLTRHALDFPDVSATLRLDGTFQARVRKPGAGRQGFDGRWAVSRGLVVAATTVAGSGR